MLFPVEFYLSSDMKLEFGTMQQVYMNIVLGNENGKMQRDLTV